METFNAWFYSLTEHMPHPWQSQLGEKVECCNRLIRIPTGMGKTFGVLSAWTYHRIQQNDDTWPRRLVWCLPMRVLVEQTVAEARQMLAGMNLLWHGDDNHADKIGVHLLMGGADSGEWHLYPEECAILIGTQDMLLSRAMNRGYASPRARWTMEFGLLNQDCLWVMDEVQLMDVGLATSGQLQTFREQDAAKSLRPYHTWWMSATLQRDWLCKSPETKNFAGILPQTEVAVAARKGHLWDDVKKPTEIIPVNDTKTFAKLIARKHLDLSTGKHGITGPTLVVVNTVDRAVEVYKALNNEKAIQGVDVRLIHSRFRPSERAGWREEFLCRKACETGVNRIIIATQVVEAGVDISACLLITELAPWASLVQRFGRSARWGGTAQVIVVDFNHKDDKKAAPYTVENLEAARDALNLLANRQIEVPNEEQAQGQEIIDVAPLHLEVLEQNHPELLSRLYPYEPRHLLLRHEIEELFDTTPDLTGADIDISRFIRSGPERDLLIFWANIPDKTTPSPDLRPCRDELCAVQFLRARDWLCGPETTSKKAPNLKPGMHSWVWDWLEGIWRRVKRRDLYPGQTVLVAASCGGYLTDMGWTPQDNTAVIPWKSPAIPLDEKADSSQDDESLSILNQWRTIATHGKETATLVREMATTLSPSFAELFHIAGRWHDAGKAFPAFQNSIKQINDRPERQDLAKAPKENWLKGKQLYPMDGTRRPGFRHELASVLALFAVLQRHNPDHPAMLGPWRDMLTKAGMLSPLTQVTTFPMEPGLLEKEILALDADRFNLLAFLICAHHGKIGIAWHACPADQDSVDIDPRLRGLREGDILPSLDLVGADGSVYVLPESRLDLSLAAAGLNPRTGPGWTERSLGLLALHGPFVLAWLTALLRAADQRASRDAVNPDPLLENAHGKPGLERGDNRLEKPAGAGEAHHPLAADSPGCSGEHGLRAGAGGSGNVGSCTRPPAHATRHIKTRLGLLTYTELAPHLAENVQDLEEAIFAGKFDSVSLDDLLIKTLHNHICGDLTPQLTGWRRHDVSVGLHCPPPYYQIPMLMREYGRDLEARLASACRSLDESLLETLAFAEGRLLSIHPFADFNGRVTRVFLRLLLHRLDLPAVDLLPPQEEWQEYLAALADADRLNWQALMFIWQQRLEKGGE
ncbi:MAG: CRISPR-associated helicase Cas3' [Pseudomonadota bacterium]